MEVPPLLPRRPRPAAHSLGLQRRSRHRRQRRLDRHDDALHEHHRGARLGRARSRREFGRGGDHPHRADGLPQASLTTLRASGPTFAVRAGAIEKFGRLFLGSLWNVYGPACIPKKAAPLMPRDSALHDGRRQGRGLYDPPVLDRRQAGAQPAAVSPRALRRRRRDQHPRPHHLVRHVHHARAHQPRLLPARPRLERRLDARLPHEQPLSLQPPAPFFHEGRRSCALRHAARARRAVSATRSAPKSAGCTWRSVTAWAPCRS